MNFEITDTTNVGQFCNVFQYLKNITEILNVTFSKDGLYIQGMDNTHVCMFELTLDNTWLSKYKYSSNKESFILAFSSHNLNKILNTRNEDQSIYFKYNQDDDKIEIKFKSKDKKNTTFNKSFKLLLLDIGDITHLNIPEFEYSAEFTTHSKTLYTIIDQLSQFHEQIAVTCNEDKIEFDANGDEMSMNVEIKMEDVIEYAVEEEETINVTFSVNYFKKICSLQKFTDNVNIKFSNNYPMFVEYKINENNKLALFLAPKIDDDE
jgi:proliferating cell nuclear antigen